MSLTIDHDFRVHADCDAPTECCLCSAVTDACDEYDRGWFPKGTWFRPLFWSPFDYDMAYCDECWIAEFLEVYVERCFDKQ